MRYGWILIVALLATPAAAETLPGYLEPFVDPVTGYTITRVTDPGNTIANIGGYWGNDARHHYSLDQAWSSDMGLVCINKGDFSGAIFLDGNTFEPLYHRNPPSSERWHTTLPDTMVWAENNQVGYYNPRTDTSRVLRTFSGYTDFTNGPSKGYMSNDGSMMAVSAMTGGDQIVFAYDMVNDIKYPDIVMPGVYGSSTISSLGDYIIAHGGFTTSSHDDQVKVFDLQGNEIQFWNEYHRPGHADVIVDSNGEQWLVGRSKDDPDKYDAIKRNLETGEVVSLIGNSDGASHTSARDITGDDVYLTFSDDPGNPFSDSVVMFNTITGDAEILSATHRYDSGYLSEAHATASPDGSQVMFASNWGSSSNGVASYVIDVPVPIPEPSTLIMLCAALVAVIILLIACRPFPREDSV